jgi:hypothetical protein
VRMHVPMWREGVQVHGVAPGIGRVQAGGADELHMAVRSRTHVLGILLPW